MYTLNVSTTITVRTDELLRRKLEKRAAAGGKNLSQVVREILEAAVQEEPLESRIGHLRGRLRVDRSDDEPWRRRLRERNWRR